MSDDFIDYGQLIDDAMHVIVQKALERVAEEGLPGKHHFFISFITEYPGVEISDALKSKYPEEMTIVLQHQFEDLHVSEEGFSAVLSFDNVREKIVIPFDSLVAFADPSVKFGLQFRHLDEYELAEITEDADFAIPGEEEFIDEVKKSTSPEKGKKASAKGKKAKNNNVVDIDSFRKK